MGWEWPAAMAAGRSVSYRSDFILLPDFWPSLVSGHLVLAWGLFQREPWARVLGLVFGFLALLRPPFGTALGIYIAMWVLLPEHSGPRACERLLPCATG